MMNQLILLLDGNGNGSERGCESETNAMERNSPEGLRIGDEEETAWTAGEMVWRRKGTGPPFL
jgi:hypothetical protein